MFTNDLFTERRRAANTGNFTHFYASKVYRRAVDEWSDSLHNERETSWMEAYRSSTPDSKGVVFAHFLPLLEDQDNLLLDKGPAKADRIASLRLERPARASIGQTANGEGGETTVELPSPCAGAQGDASPMLLLNTHRYASSRSFDRGNLEEDLPQRCHNGHFRNYVFGCCIEDLYNLLSEKTDRRPLKVRRCHSRRSDRLKALDLFLWIVRQQDCRRQERLSVRVPKKPTDSELTSARTPFQCLALKTRQAASLQNRYPHAQWMIDCELLSEGQLQPTRSMNEFDSSSLSTNASQGNAVRVGCRPQTSRQKGGLQKRVRFAGPPLAGGECTGGLFYAASGSPRLEPKSDLVCSLAGSLLDVLVNSDKISS